MMSKAGRRADLSYVASALFNANSVSSSEVGAVAHDRPRLGAI